MERQDEICGNCAATSSRPRKVSLHVVENSDPGSFLQQPASFLRTFAQLTLRHFPSTLYFEPQTGCTPARSTRDRV